VEQINLAEGYLAHWIKYKIGSAEGKNRGLVTPVDSEPLGTDIYIMPIVCAYPCNKARKPSYFGDTSFCSIMGGLALKSKSDFHERVGIVDNSSDLEPATESWFEGCKTSVIIVRSHFLNSVSYIKNTCPCSSFLIIYYN